VTWGKRARREKVTEKSAGRGKKRKVAWGISGGGDRLAETVGVMREVKEQYRDVVDVRLFFSRAGEQVAKWYRLFDGLKRVFGEVFVEVNANSPFLAGDVQTRKYEFLLVAPATSNTVAKIVAGVADTLLCNSVIMALKATVPVYVMPTDLREGTSVTKLPSGETLTLRVRKEDADNAKRLSGMDGVSVLDGPERIKEVFKKLFGS
jgi:archaeoflavoprotein AfpA